jgi:hypothetical protein
MATTLVVTIKIDADIAATDAKLIRSCDNKLQAEFSLPHLHFDFSARLLLADFIPNAFK